MNAPLPRHALAGFLARRPTPAERPMAAFRIVDRAPLTYAVERTLTGPDVSAIEAFWRSESMGLREAQDFAAKVAIRFSAEHPEFLAFVIPLAEPSLARSYGYGGGGDSNDEHRLSGSQLGVGSAGRF